LEFIEAGCSELTEDFFHVRPQDCTMPPAATHKSVSNLGAYQARLAIPETVIVVCVETTRQFIA
jgi:hypothetical protein